MIPPGYEFDRGRVEEDRRSRSIPLGYSMPFGQVAVVNEEWYMDSLRPSATLLGIVSV